MLPIVIVTALVIILACLYVLISFSLFKYAIVRDRTPKIITKDDLIKQGAGDFVDEIINAREKFFKTEYKTVSITSFDGLKLVGLLHEVQNPKGTIILFHGYRSSPVNDFCIAKDFYISKGLNVLMPYQRAHGESDGEYITFGIRERKDVHSWIYFINNSCHSHLPVFLSGLSMGCSTVLMSAEKRYPDNVKLIIADCGFTSPFEIFEHVVKTTMKIPFKPIIPLFNFICKKRAGFTVKEFSTVDAMKRCNVPVFFIHGEDDKFVPPSMTLSAFKACSSEKYLLMVPKATHALSFMVDKDTYKPTIERLLSRYIDV